MLCPTHADQHESSGDCKGSYFLIRARRAHRRSSATSTPMGVTLSPEQTAKIEEAGRPLAILWGMDRPSATEKSYLEGWRKVQGADVA